jgi:hypothetical protein
MFKVKTLTNKELAYPPTFEELEFKLINEECQVNLVGGINQKVVFAKGKNTMSIIKLYQLQML